jgi:hypothetical protein
MALCMTNTSEIKLEAVRAFWGTKHCRMVEFQADIDESLFGTAFELNYINSNLEEVLGYVYFNTNPIITGKTGYAVTILEDDTEIVVAGKVKAALDLLDLPIVIEDNGDGSIEIQNKYIGKTTVEADIDAGVTYTVDFQGVGGELGRTAQGGSTVSLETQTVEIKADQTGEIILDDIAVGNSVSVEMGLIEVTKERLNTIIGGVAGDKFSPEVGTELVGFGQSKLYQSLANLGGSLILHPIRLPMSDKSFDVVIHKCAPLPNDINYSGSDQQVLNVTFKAYLDSSVDQKVNLIAWGDWSKL